MIITLTKADFSSCKIGTLTTFNVRKSTTIGATVNIIKTSVERAGYSSATTIATIVLDEANYEGHAIKVMMGSTDVSSWYSVGNVIVPANTPITSNITISVSATAISGGEVVEPEEPGTGGGSSEPIVLADDSDYSIDGFVRPAGTIGTASPYKRTDYIDISGYNFSRLEAFIRCAALTVSPIAFFDENKEFISAVTATEETKDTAYLYSMDVPSNAAYVISSTITGAQYGFTPYLHGYK